MVALSCDARTAINSLRRTRWVISKDQSLKLGFVDILVFDANSFVLAILRSGKRHEYVV
jgi:hypothetical protein